MQPLYTPNVGGNNIQRAPPMNGELMDGTNTTCLNRENLIDEDDDSDMKIDMEMQEVASTKNQQK